MTRMLASWEYRPGRRMEGRVPKFFELNLCRRLFV